MFPISNVPVSTPSKIAHGLVKILKIDLDQATPSVPQDSPLKSLLDETYIETDPTVAEWFAELTPSWGGVGRFVLSLFPFLSWIGRYNLQWFLGDLVAGITVGAVVVPQGMAYAGLALLPPEFGLYSSFVGVSLYWFFATSKDITIGPVAVMSTLVGNVVAKIQLTHPEIPPYQAASALAVVAGSIVFLIGLVRLGFVVDYIPLPAIAAFMTGSALNIAVGQVPALLGIRGFNTRESTYKVLINTLKHIGNSRMDAVMGLSALFVLYAIRWVATSWGVRRFPKWKKSLFFVSTLRTAFVLLLYTMISWLVNMNRRDNPAFRIVGKVPRGFQHMGVPKVDGQVVSTFLPELPATVIVLLIEHIAISKSFGRVNNYTINPSQELIAIGITNIIGPFFGAYPATGSFSRTAIKSKAGVRTPFAGVITATIVLLAIYALTAVFFYIPQAALSGVIIHAVGDLITPPNTVYKFWKISPIEVLIFFAGVITTVFSSIENGIYITVATSGALLLFRIAKARGQFLGRVKVHSFIGDQLMSSQRPSLDRAQTPIPISQRKTSAIEPTYAPSCYSLSGVTEIFAGSGAATPNLNSGCQKLIPGSSSSERTSSKIFGISNPQAPKEHPSATLGRSHEDDSTRNVFLPIDRRDGSNPNIEIASPYPGVFIYRFSEGLVYSNAGHYTDYLVARIFKWTRKGAVLAHLEATGSPGDRAWNDPGPKKNKQKSDGSIFPEDNDEEAEKPFLKAIILDFSGVNNVDITSVQTLIDVRNQLDRYAAPEKVEWHFSGIGNRWTKRALASAGFGVPSDSRTIEMNTEGGAATASNPTANGTRRRWKPVFSVAEVGMINDTNLPTRRSLQIRKDEEIGRDSEDEDVRNDGDSLPYGVVRRKVAVVHSITRPFFHPDLDGAVRSAIANIEE